LNTDFCQVLPLFGGPILVSHLALVIRLNQIGMIAKFEICVVVVLLVSNYSVAQNVRTDPISPPERVYVFKSYQAVVGLNVNYGYGDDFDFVRNQLGGKQRVKIGWRVGVGATHQFLPTIDFQSMLLLEQKGWKTDVPVNPAFQQPLAGDFTDLTLTYATLVFRPVFRPKQVKRFAIGLGFFGSSLVQGKTVSITSSGSVLLNIHTAYGPSNNRNFDFGITPSISYSLFTTARMRWDLQFSNYYDLIDTTNPDIPTLSRYSNTFNVSLVTSFGKITS
jgi:hypothetical protein